MVTITTTDKSVKIETPNFTWIVKKSKVRGQSPFPKGTMLFTEVGNLNIFFNDVTADGETFDSAEELQNWVEENFRDGGGTGEGVWYGSEEQYDGLPDDKLTNGVQHFIESEDVG